MGQQVSADERKEFLLIEDQIAMNARGDQQVPYTKFSMMKKEESLHEESMKQQGGITVVHPNPEAGLRVNVPMELQKLEKIHRFWPILKSSLESTPQEKITDGVDYKHILKMCRRYQEHLGEAAKIVSHEQRALASRLRDIEMFSAGVAQQIIGRDEKTERLEQHIQRVDEVSSKLDEINSSLAHCVPLAHALNAMLPESLRLETFRVREEPPEEGVDNSPDSPDLGHRPTGQESVYSPGSEEGRGTQEDGEWVIPLEDEKRLAEQERPAEGEGQERPAEEEKPTEKERLTEGERPAEENKLAQEERPTGEERPAVEEGPAVEERPAEEERPSGEERPSNLEKVAVGDVGGAPGELDGNHL